jgi:hypothetical protein
MASDLLVMIVMAKINIYIECENIALKSTPVSSLPIQRHWVEEP